MIWDQPAAQGLPSLTHWILIVTLPLIGIAALLASSRRFRKVRTESAGRHCAR